MTKKQIVVSKILLMIVKMLYDSDELKKEIHDLSIHIGLYGEKL